MVDSTSKSDNVIPFFTDATSGTIPPSGGSGDGADLEPRVAKLEQDVSEIRNTLFRINKNLGVIEKRTRFFNRSVSHKELLIWAAVAIGALATAYCYLTPILIKAQQSDIVDLIDAKLSALPEEGHTPRKQDQTAPAAQETLR